MQIVLDYLKRNQARFVAELCEFLRFPSVSAQPQHKQDLRACAGWLANHCRQIGLDAKVCPTAGHPIVVAKTPGLQADGDEAKAELRTAGRTSWFTGITTSSRRSRSNSWKSPPFEPRIAGRSLFARGSTDNKGQHFAHLKAVEAYLKTGTPLPCDLTFVIEGEEEVGSANLAKFLKSHRRELACDAVVVSDTGMPDADHPALTYALRGIIAFEITLRGPSRDLHSGIFGGAVDNPAMALSQLLGKLRDKNGRVAIPGFYDDVAPLSAYERKEFKRLPTNDAELQKMLGVKKLFGERGFTAMEQRSARPTFEINGLTSGYQGEGSKTIVPAWARAKITCRLVPDQNPARIRKIVCNHLKKICPPIGAAGNRGRPRRGGVSRFAQEPAGAGGVARVAPGVQPRAGAAARRRLNPDCQRLQESPRRGHAAAGTRFAGRQRPFAQREV